MWVNRLLICYTDAYHRRRLQQISQNRILMVAVATQAEAERLMRALPKHLIACQVGQLPPRHPGSDADGTQFNLHRIYTLLFIWRYYLIFSAVTCFHRFEISGLSAFSKVHPADWP